MSRTPLLGCIADDFTGATDLAGTLVGAGMRTIQMIGVPQQPMQAPEHGAGAPVDAVVVALKSRTVPAADAVHASLAALRWLQAAGCRQFLFKYCSTFDSTDAGNIGPAIDALLDAMDAMDAMDGANGAPAGMPAFTIACPAFPENRRTIFQGHLFVGDRLLNESGMQDHPLTPMRDADLVRVLQRQSRRKIGLIAHSTVARGAAAIDAAIHSLRSDGVSVAIVDAICNDDLLQIGAACASLPLITGGSGIALGLPANFQREGALPATATSADALPAIPGYRAIISGSCSLATQAQVAHWIAAGGAAFAVDPLSLAAGEEAAGQMVGDIVRQASLLLPAGPVLVFATADTATVKAAQESIGVGRAGRMVEAALARIAVALVAAGVRQLVVAGGETSGAVVSALGINGLQIGPQIDPGVPWTVSLGSRPIALALKSGNFGSVDFFSKAWSHLHE